MTTRRHYTAHTAPRATLEHALRQYLTTPTNEPPTGGRRITTPRTNPDRTHPPETHTPAQDVVGA